MPTAEQWLKKAKRYTAKWKEAGSLEIAFFCWQKAAEADPKNPEAMLGMSNAYLYGHGIRADCPRGRQLLRKAATAGHAEAQCHLGRYLYVNGDLFGFRKSETMAETWFRAAAIQGHAEAQHFLGLMYARGDGGLKCDHQLAEQWLLKAAEHEDFPFPAQYLAHLWNGADKSEN